MLRFFLNLFGGGGDDDAGHHNRETDGVWRASSNGNPTSVIGGERVTVFPQDGGWTFVLGDGDEAYFSGAYATQKQAMAEAFAIAKGEVSRNATMKDRRRAEREQRAVAQWQEYLDAVETEIAEISAILERPELNITQLRKPERRIASGLKAFGWQIPKYQVEGAPQHLIAKAKRCERALGTLAPQVEGRIAARKTARSKSKKG